MNINETFPSNFLKATDLKGQEVVVTMSHITMEDVGGDHKPVLYFQGKEKGVVLNKTNATNISSMYGEETDNWAGQPVTLYTTWVDFQGRSVQAIRVRPAAPTAATTAAVAPAPPKAPEAPVTAADLDDSIPF